MGGWLHICRPMQHFSQSHATPNPLPSSHVGVDRSNVFTHQTYASSCISYHTNALRLFYNTQMMPFSFFPPEEQKIMVAGEQYLVASHLAANCAQLHESLGQYFPCKHKRQQPCMRFQNRHSKLPYGFRVHFDQAIC